MTALIKQLWNDESGATAVEYGIMVALIAAVIIASVKTFGTTVRDKLFVVTATGYPSP
jgi:pilus assembly protein Flp/PilA